MGKYEKPHLSLDQQADKLIGRGMLGDREQIRGALVAVNYYRLSGYWFTFRQEDGQTFIEGTSFDDVWSRYVLDRQVRLLVMDAIERIEVAVRTCLAYHHSEKHGPFGYAEEAGSLPGMREGKHAEFVSKIQGEYGRSKERFVKHFSTKYGESHGHLPLWIAVELMSFGNMLTLFNGVHRWMRLQVANMFRVSEPVMRSWLIVLNMIRNICAHHGRLWNRQLGIRPYIPRVRPRAPTYREWHEPVRVGNERLFTVLTICQHCLRQVAPNSKWQGRMERLLAPMPPTMLASMGFPSDWQKCPIWQRPS